MQADPGDLFVCRNAGNIVPPFATQNGGVTSTVEYAVMALGIRDIIVCGHSDCGAMKALMNPTTLDGLPSVAAWLHHSHAARNVVCASYPELEGPDDRAGNVLRQELEDKARKWNANRSDHAILFRGNHLSNVQTWAAARPDGVLSPTGSAFLAACVLMLRGAVTRRRDEIVPLMGASVLVLGLVHSSIDFSLQIPGFAIVAMSLIGLGLAQSISSASSRRDDWVDRPASAVAARPG